MVRSLVLDHQEVGMSTQVETVPTSTDSDDDELIHVSCKCDPDVALCGADLTGCPMIGWDDYPTPKDCLVCGELDELPCPRCRY